MHRFSLLSPKSAWGWRPLSEPLVTWSPNPIWLRDHCAVHKRQAGAVISTFHSRVFTATFSNPICLFFFFMNPIIANTFDGASASVPLPARMYLTSLFCRACCSGFGSLLWSEWWSEIAYSVSAKRGFGGWYERKRDFWYWQFPFHFRNEEPFSPPFPEELFLFSNLSCVNLASFKVSILNKRALLPERSCLMPVHDKAWHF